MEVRLTSDALSKLSWHFHDTWHRIAMVDAQGLAPQSGGSNPQNPSTRPSDISAVPPGRGLGNGCACLKKPMPRYKQSQFQAGRRKSYQ